jgi:ABC-type enterobactin transport system permease subunit
MHFLKMSNVTFRNLSIVCSLLLVPAAYFATPGVFYLLGFANFIIFHGIWVHFYLQDRRSFRFNKAIVREMRLPLILFALCGNAGLILIGAF